MAERIQNDTRDTLKQTLLSRERELLEQLGQVRVTLIGIAQAEALEQGLEPPVIPNSIRDLWDTPGPEKRQLRVFSNSLPGKPSAFPPQPEY